MENMKYITFANVMSRGIFTVLIFIIVNDKSDYVYVPILNSLGAIIGGFYSIWLVFRLFKLPLILPTRRNILHQIKYSSYFFLSRLANISSSPSFECSSSIIKSFLSIVPKTISFKEMGLVANNSKVPIFFSSLKAFIVIAGISIKKTHGVKIKNDEFFRRLFTP